MKVATSKFRTFLLLFTVVAFVLSSKVTVFAAEEGGYSTVGDVVTQYGYGSTNQKSSVTNYLSTQNDGVHDTAVTGADGNVYYYDKSQEDQIVATGNNLYSSQVKASEGQAVVKHYSDQIGDLGLTADVGTATGMLSGFMGVLRTLLGIIVVLISVGMTVFSAFDLAYIAFPVFRNKCEDSKQSGGVMAKKGSNGETKLRFVSDDAQYAVVAADTVQSGKNPFIIYFGKRLISYLVLAVLLFILLTGKVTVFTDIAIRLVSGFINLLQEL